MIGICLNGVYSSYNLSTNPSAILITIPLVYLKMSLICT